MTSPRDADLRLPTFFVIGAPKCGTTSLHRYLDAHPDIAMTSVKEPLIFAAADWEQRVAEYDSLLAPGPRICGESSTGYSAYPWQPDIPERVRTLVPDARIVYLVRDPVPRTLSHYAQNLWDHKPVRPFDELMDDLEDPLNMPVWCSRYATQIERWIDRFGAEQVLVVDGRDLQHRRRETVQRIAGFLGADPAYSSPDWVAEHNARDDHRVPNRLARMLGHSAATAGSGPLRRLMTRPMPLPELSSGQRARLEALLAPEAQRLREMTALPLAHWTV
jgi:hypothetical protein